MRKIFKKAIAAVASLAMVAGMMATMPANEVKAATDVKLYVKVADATQYGVNMWSDVTVTGGANVDTWSGQTHPSLIADGTDWGYVTVSDSSKVQGMQVVKAGTALETANGNNIWNATIASLGLTEAYYDSVAATWYKDKACTEEVKPPTLDDIYNVAGDEGLTGVSWAPDKNAMTADGDNFTITFKNVAVGKYGYKILQDQADFGWDNPYTAESAGEKASGNGSVEVTAVSDVTMTINKTTKVVTVTITPVKTEDKTPVNPSQEDTKNPSPVTSPVTGKIEIAVDSVADAADVAALQAVAAVKGAEAGVVLVVSEPGKTAVQGVADATNAKAELDGKDFQIVDLKLEKNGVVVTATGKYTVTLKVFGNLTDAKYINVYRLDGTTLKLVDEKVAVAADGKFSFETDHFSTYVFAETTAPAAGETPDSGDSAPVMAMIALAAVACAAAVVVSKKKAVNN